jgi:hypothetical protein
MARRAVRPPPTSPPAAICVHKPAVSAGKCTQIAVSYGVKTSMERPGLNITTGMWRVVDDW